MNKKNQKQRIVINGDVKMDTVTVYSDNQIKVTACPWMADRADEVAPDGRLRMKGCTILEPGAQMVFRPYNIGSLVNAAELLCCNDNDDDDADARGASVAFGPYGRRTLFATTGGLSPQRSTACCPYENDNDDQGALIPNS